MKKYVLVILLAVLFEFSSQSFSLAIVKPPEFFNAVQNESTIENSMDNVWKKIISTTDDKFFEVISKDEKNHVLKFRFFSDKPWNFIVCNIDNKMVETYNGFNFKEEILKLKQLEPLKGSILISNDVINFVDGEATVSLESRGDGISVVINVNYKLHLVINRTEKVINLGRKGYGVKSMSITDECNFSTLSGGRCYNLKGIICFSNGIFEKVFLEYIQK